MSAARTVTDEQIREAVLAVRAERGFHVAPIAGGWAVTKTGGKRALRRLPTKREAGSFARERARSARGGLVYFHRKDGTVERAVEVRG